MSSIPQATLKTAKLEKITAPSSGRASQRELSYTCSNNVIWNETLENILAVGYEGNIHLPYDQAI
jgi:hypothetical protein